METNIEDIQESREFYFDKPGLMTRVKSTLIDVAVIFSLMIIASYIFNALRVESGGIKGFILIVILMYEPIMVSYGRTVGQKLMGLQVYNFSDVADEEKHRTIGLIASLFRYAIKLLLGWISLLTIHSDDYGRAIHDNLVGSVMTFR